MMEQGPKIKGVSLRSGGSPEGQRSPEGHPWGQPQSSGKGDDRGNDLGDDRVGDLRNQDDLNPVQWK